MYTYPQLQDDPNQYANLIGSFWTGPYGDADLVLNYLQAVQLNAAQIQQDLQELQDSVGYQTCPVYHTYNWYQVVLLQSQESSLSFPLPAEVRDLEYGANQLTNPTVVFTQGVNCLADYSAHTITFLADPFQNPLLSQLPVFDVNGNVVDHLITLFFFRVQVDWLYLYQQFGYILGLNLPSNQPYKDFISALLTAFATATAYDNITKAFAAIADCPCVLSDGEVVQAISTDHSYLLIATNLNIYRFFLGSTPIVAVGDVVNKDDQLVDTVAIYSNTQGIAPPINDIQLGAGFLDPTIAGPLTFGNASVPLVVTPNVAGFTKLSWSLGGNPTDATNFFNILHTKGVAAGATLANYLDLRPQPQPTQPTAASLPTTINPMQFLFQNVMRANAFLVELKTFQFGYNALGLNVVGMLRKIVPPHNAMLLLLQQGPLTFLEGDGFGFLNDVPFEVLS